MKINTKSRQWNKSSIEWDYYSDEFNIEESELQTEISKFLEDSDLIEIKIKKQ